ncbi:hypothetical protein HYU10_04925 [Candidatus Woesearchaeota archaeon]|nr:hypothetical protein [Candidatus Woesearchaeota archaeon]
MPFQRFFDPVLFGTELAFTVIAVVFCFLIYFKTRESYELTRYNGIKYFRDAFLFFGLSYVLRFLFSLALLSSIAFDFFLPRSMSALFFILPLSTIGIFYLIFSSIWKKYSGKRLVIMGHGTAALLVIVSFLTRSHHILLVFQSVLLLIAVVFSGIIHKKMRISGARAMYLLVALLWLINLWVIGPRRRRFSLEIELFFGLVSLAVFIAIYSKVCKWVK